MRLSKSCHERRLLCYGGSTEPPSRTLLQDEEVAALSRKDAVAPVKGKWEAPDRLLQIARMAAGMARRRFWRFHKFDDADVDDAAQEIVTEYLTLPGYERPRTKTAFEAWALKAAMKEFNRHFCRVRREIADEIVFDDGGVTLLSDRYRMTRVSRADQETILYAKQVFEAMERLPPTERAICMAVAASGDPVALAEDQGVSLFDTVAQIRRAREIMRRYADDEMEDRREASQSNGGGRRVPIRPIRR